MKEEIEKLTKNTFEFQRMWKFWRDQKEYTSAEKAQMKKIHEAFGSLKYQRYSTSIISAQSQSARESSTSNYLLLEETILEMRKDFKMPNLSDKEMVWAENVAFNPKLDLEYIVVQILDFMKNRTRSKGQAVSFKGYYNDPINLTSSFIISLVREICLHFNLNDLNNIKKTQENFEALRIFIEDINANFLSLQWNSNEFINLLALLGSEIKKKIEGLTLDIQEANLKFYIESFDQNSNKIIQDILSYLVKVLMSNALREQRFHIKHLLESNNSVKNNTFKQKLEGTEFGKQIIRLYSIPAFSIVIDGKEDLNKQIQYLPNLFLIEKSNDVNRIKKITLDAKAKEKSKSHVSEEEKLMKDAQFMKVYEKVLGYIQEYSEQLIVFRRLKALITLLAEIGGIAEKERVLALMDIISKTLNNLEKGINYIGISLGEKKATWINKSQINNKQPTLYIKLAANESFLKEILSNIGERKNELRLIKEKVNECDVIKFEKKAKEAIKLFENSFEQILDRSIKLGLISTHSISNNK